jgi:hypothetical protein
MAEAQAVDRVHRIGQVRPVSITRYIVPESIETVRTSIIWVVFQTFSTAKAYLTSEQYIQWVQEDKVRLINQSINDTNGEADNGSQMLKVSQVQ